MKKIGKIWLLSLTLLGYVHREILSMEKVLVNMNLLDEPIAEKTQSSVKLVKRTLVNRMTYEEQPCFQFIDENNVPSDVGQMLYYDIPTLKYHLASTAKAYKDAIESIVQQAYNDLKMYLTNNYIDNDCIQKLLTNYLDELNEDERINNVTGSPLSEKEMSELLLYMELCKSIYTDYYTRDHLIQKNLSTIEKKWNEIRHNKETFISIEQAIRKIRDKWNNIPDTAPVFVGNGGLFSPQQQSPSIEKELARENCKEYYAILIERINIFLSSIKKNSIDSNDIKDIDSVLKKLGEIGAIIDSEFSWYFSEKKEEYKGFFVNSLHISIWK